MVYLFRIWLKLVYIIQVIWFWHVHHEGVLVRGIVIIIIIVVVCVHLLADKYEGVKATVTAEAGVGGMDEALVVDAVHVAHLDTKVQLYIIGGPILPLSKTSLKY